MRAWPEGQLEGREIVSPGVPKERSFEKRQKNVDCQKLSGVELEEVVSISAQLTEKDGAGLGGY